MSAKLLTTRNGVCLFVDYKDTVSLTTKATPMTILYNYIIAKNKELAKLDFLVR